MAVSETLEATQDCKDTIQTQFESQDKKSSSSQAISNCENSGRESEDKPMSQQDRLMIRLTEFEGRIEAMQELKQSLYEAIRNIEPTPESEMEIELLSQIAEPPTGPEFSLPYECASLEESVTTECVQLQEEKPLEKVELSKDNSYEEEISLPTLSDTEGRFHFN